MNCRQVRDALPLYVGADLEVGERARVDGHLGECADCRTQLEQTRAVFAPLRALGSTGAPVPDAEAMWCGIQARMGWKPAETPQRRTAPIGGWSIGLRRAASLAAVFLLGIGLGFASTFFPAKPSLPQPDWSSPHRDLAASRPETRVELPAFADYGFDEVQPVDTGSGSRRFLLWNVQPSQGAQLEAREARFGPGAVRFHLEQIRTVDHDDLVAGY